MNDRLRSSESDGRRTDAPVLVSLDLLLIASLIVVGRTRHGESAIADPLGTAGALLPFLAGWLVVAWLAGLYGTRRRSTVGTVRAVAVCWLGAANVGFLLRGSPAFQGGIAWEFVVVLTGLGLLVLVLWRAAYATLLVGRLRVTSA